MAEQTTLLKKLSFSYAKRHGVFVNAIENDIAEIVYSTLPTTHVLQELQRSFGVSLKLRSITKDEFEQLLTDHYQTNSNQAMAMAKELGDETGLFDLIQKLPETKDLLEMEDDAPIIRLLNALLSEAINKRASDIHIETYENRLTIRFRIDGILQEILEPERILSSLIVSRIKVMAKLDIAEKRLPQDGRITLKIAGHNIDVRVSTLPTSHGERVVLRLLDKKNTLLDLLHLGMQPETLHRIESIIKEPHGIFLVTGPTGSGKTTTLYAALNKINESTRNIMTVEDPVEYDLPGISQTQLNAKVDMTFAKGLRAILRQDPDVVMVGEIRDLETAQIAIQASMTGHLVFSTLHTNTALSAITRLIDIGTEPFLLASSLMGVLAQRLVRILCSHCKVGKKATIGESQLLGVSEKKAPTIYHHQGCDECQNTGYRGRSGIYELITIDEELRQMIHRNQDELSMRRYIRQYSPSIRSDGFSKVLEGVTTLEEVLRVSTEE